MFVTFIRKTVPSMRYITFLLLLLKCPTPTLHWQHYKQSAVSIRPLVNTIIKLLFISAKPHPLFTVLICNVNDEVTHMKIKLHWNPCTEVKNWTSVKIRAVWTAASQHPRQLPSLTFSWLGKKGSCAMFRTFWLKKMLTVSYLYRVNSSHFYLPSRSTLSSPSVTLCPIILILLPCPPVCDHC